MANPILRDTELEQLRHVRSDLFMSWTIDTTWPVAEGAEGLERGIERLCAEADAALAAGSNILILSDRHAGPERVPMPSLLATSAVHNHLVRCRHAPAGRASSSSRASRAACTASRRSSATARPR